MYQILVDDTVIYDEASNNLTLKITDGKLTLEDNSAGSLEFVIPSINVGYNMIRRMKSHVVVKRDGVKIWGNKTMYSGDTPMNRVNVVRLMLYMRKLIAQAALKLIFDQNDATLRNDFEGIIKPILSQIKTDRGITDYRLTTSQTPEQMDAHEISAVLYVKPTPTLEYIEINFVVTPQGVQFDEI